VLGVEGVEGVGARGVPSKETGCHIADSFFNRIYRHMWCQIVKGLIRLAIYYQLLVFSLYGLWNI